MEQDVRDNYSKKVVILSNHGTFRGYDGVRQSAALLHQKLPNATYEFSTQLTEGESAFLVWSARSAQGLVRYGADSFVIKNGLIVVQTIFYLVE